ncbi:MAG: hypothetical protein ACR2LT_07600 [Pyrinomonadaceae bacterium]
MNAQNSNPSQPSTATGTSRQVTTTTPVTGSSQDVNNRFDNLRSLEIKQIEEKTINGNPLDEVIERVYRKPNKEELRLLAPSPELLVKYAGFLSQPETGIVRLNGNSDCAESAAVVNAKENCLPYSMPGAGTAYSFRTESYRAPHLSDLILSKNVLITDGVLQQGIMVNLGNIPLEEVSLQTKGLKYLVDFTPVSNSEDLSKFDDLLSKGVNSDGFLYRLGFYAADQTTFALRSIAYKGNVTRSFKGKSYNEMDFDKRKDVIVAFRVVEQRPDGSVTILWKVLARRNAPTLKIDEKNNRK